MMKLTGPVKKIAILRANSVGDFLFCLPALEALRAAYLQAEIVYLGRPWHKDFLEGRSNPIDRVVVVPVSNGVRDEEDGSVEDRQEVEAFIAQMQREQFDMALQIHGGGQHTNPFIKKFGAALTAGFQAPDAEPLDICIPYSNFQNDIFRNLEAVQKLGVPIVATEPRIALARRDLEEADAALGNSLLPFIVLHIGAHDPRRRWPAENFAVVGDHFAGQGYRVVVTGGTNEIDHADAVARSMRAPCENLAGKISLSGLAGVLSQSTLVISNDTGPLHLANALGKRTVGLYWVGNLINFGTLYRENHIPLVSWTLTCPECGRSCIIGNLPGESPARCEHVSCFITDIPVRDVIAAAESLLSTAPHPVGKEVHYGDVPAEDR